MWQDFKEFAMKGNMIELAVGVIIGTAFGKIVSSLVNDVAMPVLGLLLGGINFAGLKLQVGDAVIKYGAFIQSVVDFLLIAAAVFMTVRFISKLNKEKAAEPAPAPAPGKEEVLLAEIRDILKEQAR